MHTTIFAQAANEFQKSQKNTLEHFKLKVAPFEPSITNYETGIN